jgi:hypothetical protein
MRILVKAQIGESKDSMVVVITNSFGKCVDDEYVLRQAKEAVLAMVDWDYHVLEDKNVDK